MTELFKKKFYPLSCGIVFTLCVVLSALVSGMIITGKIYTPYEDSPAFSTLFGTTDRFLNASRSSALQILAIYLAGYSSLVSHIGLLIMLYRGIAFGYTVSLVIGGKLVLDGGVGSILPLFGISSAAVLTLYFASSFLIAVLCYLAVCRFESYMYRGDLQLGDSLRYTVKFAVFGGAVFLCDFLKLIVL